MNMNMRKLLQYQNAQEQQLHDKVCRIAACLKECKITYESELENQLRELVDLLVHAGECKRLSSSPSLLEYCCSYPNCSKGKELFRHSDLCMKRVCELCKSLMRLLKFHAGGCKRSDCRVPRCRVIKICNRPKKELQRLRQLIRMNKMAARRLKWQLHSIRERMSCSGGAGAEEEEEIRVLEGKIKALKEKLCILKRKVREGKEAGGYDEAMQIHGNEGGGYETKMARREERWRRWKEGCRVKELELQLNLMNI